VSFFNDCFRSVGNVYLAHFLIGRGAVATLRDNQGYNSLHLAAQAGHSNMIVYLVNGVGVDVNSVDSMNRLLLFGIHGYVFINGFILELR
jgi:ankyrin repeat protein